MLGCFDSKIEDFNYFYFCFIFLGVKVFFLNIGVFEVYISFLIDIFVEEIV